MSHKCENTNHKGKHTNVEYIRLTNDFEDEDCYWCKSCRKRDADMIAGPISPYEEKYLKFIKNCRTDGEIIAIVNRIYDDAFSDGFNSKL